MTNMSTQGSGAANLGWEVDVARLEMAEGLVMVTLSRRNLRSLLHKLDWPESARAITNGDCYRDGEPIGDVLLVLRAEDDDEHYAARPDPRGLMHPRTELAITDPATTAEESQEGAEEGAEEGAGERGEAGREAAVQLLVSMVLSPRAARRTLALANATQGGSVPALLGHLLTRELARADPLESIVDWEREHGAGEEDLGRLRADVDR
ncbi:MAG: hypothetical protein AB7L91_15430 [Dehalococcoidia bacterium]